MQKTTCIKFFLLVCLTLGSFACKQSTNRTELSDGIAKGQIPTYALNVLKYIHTHQKAPLNYVGGRRFKNLEKRLPKFTIDGRVIAYKEWDVHPKIRGKNRGAERLVTGNNSSAYFTNNHYQSFKKIR